MRGIEKAVFLIIAILVVIFLVGIYLYFGGTYVLAYAFPKAKSQYFISSLCSEWSQNRCTKSSAEAITTTVDKIPKTLKELCEDAYGHEADVGDKWWTDCKEFCKGCPS